MSRQQGANAKMAMAFESTYGTPPGSGFIQMPFASETLGAVQPLNDNELVGYGRDPLAPTKDAVSVDGGVEVPIDEEAFGHWLKATFGDPTTTGTGPYTHEFVTGKKNLPSLSIEVQMPDVPRFAMYSGSMVDSLSWQMSRSGQLRASLDLICQGESIAVATAAGTPSQVTLSRFGHFNGAVERDGVALGNIVSADIEYRNNLDRIETIRSDGRISGADPSIAALTGKLVTRFDGNTLVDQATNGDPCELTFEYTMAGGKSLTMVVHEVYLPRPRIPINGPNGVQAEFDWQAALNSTEGNMATVTLVNEVESY